MKEDPFLKRESLKYSAPIPSREFILDYFLQQGASLGKDELIKAFKLVNEEQQEALRRRLRAMERDGQLVFTNKKKYILPEKLNLMKGTVIGHRDGYGFLRIEGEKKDYYIAAEQMKSVLHGDVVLVQVAQPTGRGRSEVKIVRVIVPRNTKIVGRYFIETGQGFVVPDDNRLCFDIMIPKEYINGARMGFIVVVELIQRPSKKNKAIGKIVEILGEKMDTNIVVDIAIRNYEIPYLWSEALLKETTGLTEEVPETAKQDRTDIRNLPLVTIDGEDARDFDDAVYCEKNAQGWKLWVAIADVSYYVRPHTLLDKEARHRGNSVYFPSQVIPMLPEILSNGLCSLNPDLDRLCMVCEMQISNKGKLVEYHFYEAVMKSHARLTYTKVAHILQGDEELRQRYQTLVPHLEEIYRLYQQLDRAREIRGGIAFETEEPKFIFNAERRIERIESMVRNDAHKIIEECMIIANVAAASFVTKAEEPALYRVHDKPDPDHLRNVRSILSELGLVLEGGEQPEPKDYAILMDQVASRPDHEMLQTLLLRSMKQAIYDPDNRGHFGLALQAYAHFTSPIRRYPDLTLHRGIKYILAQRSNQRNSLSSNTGRAHSTIEEMLQLGEHCSMTERRADEATRDVADWLKCDFMQDYVGQNFTGVISGVTSFGFFVRLDELFIDGLVHISTLKHDYYQYDAIRQRIFSEISGLQYKLGDKVEVKVMAVNIDERKIDFALISSTRVPQRVGKTAKKKQQALQKMANSLNKNSKLEIQSEVKNSSNFRRQSSSNKKKKSSTKTITTKLKIKRTR